jgi:hypothetical protein
MAWTDLKLDNFVFFPKKTSPVEISAGDISAKKSGNKDNRKKSDDDDYFGSNYICKGIDLESAVPVNQPIRDFSPEVAAPEQIEILLGGQLSTQGGRSSDFKLATREPLLGRKETDIWALGISILHLYLGK